MAAESTAPCERCEAEIPADAVECPECGYEHPWGRENRIVVSLISGTALLFSGLATSYVAALWLTDETARGFPVAQFVTWLAPGLLAAALLYFALGRPPRSATGDPIT